MAAAHDSPPVPLPLDQYAYAFDDLFHTSIQRRRFRDYLAGLLLPRCQFTAESTPPHRGETAPARYGQTAPGNAVSPCVPLHSYCVRCGGGLCRHWSGATSLLSLSGSVTFPSSALHRQAVTPPRDEDHRCTVNQAIQRGAGQKGIAEELGPLTGSAVAGDDDTAALVAPVGLVPPPAGRAVECHAGLGARIKCAVGCPRRFGGCHQARDKTSAPNEALRHHRSHACVPQLATAEDPPLFTGPHAG